MPTPPPPAEFDAYAQDYDAALNQGLSLTGEAKEYFAEGRVAWLRERLAARGAAPRTCLDFGCGTGTSAAYLTRGLGLTQYVGYDPSADSIVQARQSAEQEAAGSSLGSGGAVRGHTIRFASHASDLAPESADLAFCNGVFHHIPPEDRDAAIALVWQTLRPGGCFAFWENNRWNPAVHWVMSRVPFDRDARMMFPHQARALLRNGGFEIIRSDYLFVFPSAFRWLRPLEPALCKLPLGGQYLVLARKP